MEPDIVEQWRDLIEAANTLTIDGPPLEARFENLDELKYALMAMVIYSSRLEAQGEHWTFVFETEKTTMFIYKVHTGPVPKR